MRLVQRDWNKTALALLIPCWLALAALRADAAVPGSASGAPVYRIMGVVASSRDGSPVPRCRMTVTESDVPRHAMSGSGGGTTGPGAAMLTDRLNGSARQGRFAGEASPMEPEPVLTDSRGRFSVTVPGPGMWRLTGAARGFRTQAYDEHEGFWSGIVLTAAAPEISLSFRLTPDAAISGVVFDEAGERVRTAQVRAERVVPQEANRATRGGPAGVAMTDDRGHYELPGLAPGEYRLRVSARPWYAAGPVARGGAPESAPLDPSLDVVYPETWFPAATEESAGQTITLGGGEERQADFHLTPVPSVHLKIPRETTGPEDNGTPRGARPPMVVRESSDGAGFTQTQITSNSSNEWDIGGLSPGRYQIRLPDQNGPGQTVSRITVSADSGTALSLGAAQPGVLVTITVDGVPDNEVNQVIFFDPASGERYTSAGGRRGRRRTDVSDADPSGAEARTISVPSGRYEVFLGGAAGLCLTGLSATGAQVVGRTIDVAAGSPKLIVHAANGMGEVSGVARMQGKPAAGAMVLLVPAGFGKAENLAPIERDQTNTDGSFLIRNVFPGEYIVVAIDHGWGVNWHDSTTLTQYLAKGTPIDLHSAGRMRTDVEATVP